MQKRVPLKECPNRNFQHWSLDRTDCEKEPTGRWRIQPVTEENIEESEKS